MIEVETALYNYLKSDTGKDNHGIWLDSTDQRTYAAMLGATASDIHKHLIPTRQPQVIEDNLPIVSFYTIDMPINSKYPDFKNISIQIDIYSDDVTMVELKKIARRHFQLLDNHTISTSLPLLGIWRHAGELQTLLSLPNLRCYTQRFVVPVKRYFAETGKKK
jgi:hypothetical protein